MRGRRATAFLIWALRPLPDLYSILGARLKSDDPVLNLAILSLLLDFGLARDHAASLCNLPFLQVHSIA